MRIKGDQTIWSNAGLSNGSASNESKKIPNVGTKMLLEFEKMVTKTQKLTRDQRRKMLETKEGRCLSNKLK